MTDLHYQLRATHAIIEDSVVRDGGRACMVHCSVPAIQTTMRPARSGTA